MVIYIISSALIGNFQGIWIGMLTGTAVQTAVLFWMIGKTNWDTEVSF
jgi:Na+-driven multidrug efflux pump